MIEQKSDDLLGDNPMSSEAGFERDRPAAEVLLELFREEVAAAMLRWTRKVSNPLVTFRLRISPAVVAAYKSRGSWCRVPDLGLL
jgi:uncharacterized protein (DUF4415 family)